MSNRQESLHTLPNGDIVKLVALYFPNLYGPDSIQNFALVQHQDNNVTTFYEGIGDKGLLKVVTIQDVLKLNMKLLQNG